MEDVQGTNFLQSPPPIIRLRHALLFAQFIIADSSAISASLLRFFLIMLALLNVIPNSAAVNFSFNSKLLR